MAKVVLKPSDEGIKIELQGGAPAVHPNMRITA